VAGAATGDVRVCRYLSAVLGVVGLVAAELWRLKRWNPWLIVIVCVVGILSAAPRLTEAPNALLRILATGGVVGGALIFLLVVLPNLRRAYT
jgi:hypothetical protein